jgi:osmotically-inducible protein OsmY
MEASDPDVERLPGHVDNSDLDLRDDVYTALRTNGETFHLTEFKVQVDEGVVNLLGTVPTEDDIGRVYAVVKTLTGVAAIQNNLQTWMR